MAADQGVTVAAPTSLTVGRRAALALLLVPPLAWLVVAYLGSLAVLLVSAFWTTDSFTGAVVHTFTGDNVVRVLTDEVFRVVTLRTVGVALLVTVCCIVLAVPLALYMAKVASPRTRLLLVVAVTTPLWASYLVKAYAWRMMFSPGGPLDMGYRVHARVRVDGDGRHADLPVAAVHGHPGVRGVRTSTRRLDRRQFGPRRI